MARQVGPDQAERIFYYTSGSKKGTIFPSGTPVPLYADNQASLPADVRSLDGSVIAGTIPTVLIGDTLEVPQFLFPDVADPVVYTRIGGGPIVALHPATDARVDDLRTRVVALEPGGIGEAANRTLTNLTDAAAARSALGLGNSATRTVGTSSNQVAAGDAPAAAQAAAISTAATDATAKAGAAQTAAISAAVAADLLKADRNLIVSPRYRAQPQLTMFETFQATNGWSANVGTWTGDTTNMALGSRCITTTTNGAGLANTYRKLAQPPQNLTSKNFAMLVKVDQPTRLGSFSLYVGTGNLTAFDVLTAGNGGAAANAIVQPNVWTWIYFSWADRTSGSGTPDRTAITDWQIRVVDNSTGAVTFSLNAIGTWNKPSLYPNGVVTITFDDCWDSQASLAAPTLDLYGYGANAMVIVQALGDTATGKFSQATLDSLQSYHRWEVGGHAYTYAAHNAGFSTLGSSALDDELLNLRDWLRRNGYRGHDLFAYPLGDDNQAVNDNVGRYFTFARQIVRVPSLPMPVDQPMRLRSYSVSSSDSLATVQGKVDAAYNNGTWLVLTFHKLVAGTPSAGTEWPNADFTSLVAYINGKGMPVMTLGAVLDSIRA